MTGHVESLPLEARVNLREQDIKSIAQEITELTRILTPVVSTEIPGQRFVKEVAINYPLCQVSTRLIVLGPDMPLALRGVMSQYHEEVDSRKERLAQALYDHLYAYLELIDRAISSMLEHKAVDEETMKRHRPRIVREEVFNSISQFVLKNKTNHYGGEVFKAPFARECYGFVRYIDAHLGPVDCESKSNLRIFVDDDVFFEAPDYYRVVGPKQLENRGIQS